MGRALVRDKLTPRRGIRLGVPLKGLGRHFAGESLEVLKGDVFVGEGVDFCEYGLELATLVLCGDNGCGDDTEDDIKTKRWKDTALVEHGLWEGEQPWFYNSRGVMYIPQSRGSRFAVRPRLIHRVV